MSALDKLLSRLPCDAPTELPGGVIHNETVEGSGEFIQVRNPATGQVVARFAAASNRQVRDALDAARAALKPWRATPAAERCKLLARVANAMEARQDELVRLQQLSNGKPRAEAQADVADAVATFRYYAGLCEWPDFDEEALQLPAGEYRAVRRYESCGVAVLVLPWNFPLVTAAWKIAPALAAGCTVVVKPSELAPLPELAMAELFLEAGLPPGVANWVFGARSVGQELVSAPDVEKISFTGSTVTGRAVAHAAAERIGRVTLELGGKSPLIVCDSADLHSAVDLAVAGVFTNAGQMCSATARILVQRRLYERFMDLFVATVEALQPVGTPDSGTGQYGPLISQGQKDKVVTAIAIAVRDGLALVAGGAAPETAGEGYFVQPTIFRDVPTDHPLWRDEVFGPIACVRPFDTDEAALAMANDTEYGLAATVVTEDKAQARRFEAGLRAGIVWLDTPQLVFPEVGWGGFGKSGIGRELGLPGLRAFQEAKHVVWRETSL
jgi:betaine-aldehyde dehydrogenase